MLRANGPQPVVSINTGLFHKNTFHDKPRLMMNGLVLTMLALCTNLTVSHTPWNCSGFKSVDMSADGKMLLSVHTVLPNH